MKNIYKLFTILVLSITYNTAAQQDVAYSYPGTWQYDSGNERFIVKLWMEDGAYLGHYKKTRIDNGSLIYTSRLSDNTGTVFLPLSIYTKEKTFYGLTGIIDDYTIPGHADNPRRGYIQIKLKPYDGYCIDCGVQAEWNVTPLADGITVGGPAPAFSVPLHIVLTKVSDSVTLD